MDHLDDGADALSLLADGPGEGAAYSISAEALARLPSLSLRRWSGWRCAPVGQPARHEEAGEPAAVCASVRKASDIGAEQNHLCPTSSRRSRRPQASAGWCWRARPSRPASRSSPCRWWRRASRDGRDGAGRRRPQELGHPGRGERRPCERRDGGVGHGHRAADAGLDLGEQVDEGRMGDVAAGRSRAGWVAGLERRGDAARGRRDGTPPRRAGGRRGRRGGARAGGGWPRGPPRGAPRRAAHAARCAPSPPWRATASASGRSAQRSPGGGPGWFVTSWVERRETGSMTGTVPARPHRSERASSPGAAEGRSLRRGAEATGGRGMAISC